MEAQDILPTEIWMIILKKKGCREIGGILRNVCTLFRDILIDQKKSCAHLVCHSQHLLAYSLRYLNPPPKKQVFTEMIAINHPAETVVHYSKVHGFEMGPSVMCVLVSKGDVEGIKTLRENGCNWDVGATNSAIRHDQFETYLELVKMGCPVNGNLLEAIGHGKLKIAQYIFSTTPWGVIRLQKQLVLTAHAIRSGNLEMLRWLRSINLLSRNEMAFRMALRRSPRPILDFLKNEGIFHRSRLNRYMIVAAYFGNLEGMKWLISQGAGWHSKVITIAGSNQEIIDYAIANGCPLPE